MWTNFRFEMRDRYLVMVKGDTLSFGVEISDQDGNPVNISDAHFTCKKSYTDAVSVFEKSYGDGITESKAGKYVVRVAPDDTVNVEAGKYFYDLQIDVGNDVFTILRGVLEIDQDVTN